MVILENEWTEWKEHPITVEFFKTLNNGREILKEMLAFGNVENVEYIQGKLRGFYDIKEMKYEEFMEMKNDK